MNGHVLTSIAAYGGSSVASSCVRCGAPLLTAYVQAGRRGLQLTRRCSADCGYARRPVRRRPSHPLDLRGLEFQFW